jgi:protein required for attachment to host cells
MSKYTVVVADALRARFFALKDAAHPELESGPKLVEAGCLMNPEKAQTETRRRGTPLSGGTRASSGGYYAFDDHRGKHELDEMRRFARIVVREALKQTRKEDSHSLVIASDRKMLGLVREQLAEIKTNGLDILELNREITGEKPDRIQALLARNKLIPAMRKPATRVRSA